MFDLYNFIIKIYYIPTIKRVIIAIIISDIDDFLFFLLILEKSPLLNYPFPYFILASELFNW